MRTSKAKTLALPSISEKDFQQQVIDFAKLHKWKVYHTYDSRRCTPGFPDLVLVRERAVWVEVKSDLGTLTSSQKEWLDCLERAGQEVYVWRPSTWLEIQRVLS